MLEDKICTIDNDIAIMSTKLQNRLERLTSEVKEDYSKVNDKKELKIKCKLGEFTMVSQPITLILVDWFIFKFFLCFFRSCISSILLWISAGIRSHE